MDSDPARIRMHALRIRLRSIPGAGAVPAYGPRTAGAASAWGPRSVEAAAVLVVLAVGFLFLSLRIRTGGLPGGDEGSWIAVAAELAAGNGFTTRWLEAHFLVPYALPRPDDFRYPALVSLLAGAFRVFGASIETARWTVGAIFLAFAAAVWGVSRAAFGRWTALAALSVTVASLLQLEWNAKVYTEGLFGLAAAGLAAWCLRGERTRGTAAPFGFGSHAWWAGLGLAIGLLYLVRVNGILFLPGILWLWLRRRGEPLRMSHPAAAFAAFALAASPWLLRTALDFGNPFHFAGSGGLLRDPGSAATQSHTLSAAEYFGRHDAFFLPRRLLEGARRLLLDLHGFEHGLEAAPLALALAAAIRRKPGFGPAFAAGFAFTAAACAYAAYNSWAGVRYLSGLLPFAYAYGFSLLAQPAARLLPQRLLLPAGALGLALALAPVVQPHRFYLRSLPRALAADGPYAYRSAVAEHLAELAEKVPPGGHYYAASLCNLNFLAPGRLCVGLQELYDPSWLPRSRAAFHPSLVALTAGELRDTALAAALLLLREAPAAGSAADSVSDMGAAPPDSGSLGFYFPLPLADAVQAAPSASSSTDSESAGSGPSHADSSRGAP